MNKVKEEIKNFLLDREKASLKDIYVAIQKSPPGIRSILNLSIKNEEGIFVRIEKGVYALKSK